MNITSPDGFIITQFPVEELWALKGKRGDRERCAVLLGRYTEVEDKHIFSVVGIIEVPNSAEDTEDHFRMSVGDIVSSIPAAAMGVPIIGFLHTHLDGGPDVSMEDIKGVTKSTVAHFVFHPSSGTLTMYNGDGYITKFKIKESK